jgi:hypothetical protein
MRSSSSEGVNSPAMQLFTRAIGQAVPGLAHGTVAYLGLNVVLLAAEARWHLLYRLMLWDVSELKTFGFLLGKTLHP